ncbi:16880_t:CDS:1 [Dentiscutata heterogama]|uniref:16880_t:CDS:1 n=1 Tax=Dentiscutata heterogama TaxID=1316150 RepID=A0ACA9P7M2_9GLOM|nr:16880_t:CDS:1 [Dentiscutata heterogama]
MTSVPVCDPHLMISTNINRNPKKIKEFIHSGVECVEYNGVTGSTNIKIEMIVLYSLQSVRFKHLGSSGINIKVTNNYLISGFIKFSDSGKMLIEATDIDYQKSSIYNSTMSEILSDKSQKTHSIIEIIADDSESSTTQTSNCQFSSKTSFVFANSSAEINPTFEQKNDLNLEAENDNEEQKSNHEEENEILSDKNVKTTDENKEDQPKKRKRSIRTSEKEKGNKTAK